MKPSEIITPDHVRWVLGIEKKDIKINIYTTNIEFSELPDNTARYYEVDNIEPFMDIHCFIYLAIEKCAAEGWMIICRPRHGVVVRTAEYSSGSHKGFPMGDNDYPDMLHAQLAAIAWVYSKMQEGK